MLPVMWYRYLYGMALVIALVRAWKFWRVVPFWCGTLVLGLAASLSGYPLPVWCVFSLPCFRALASVEAFANLTLSPKAWMPGSHLLRASWALALAFTLAMKTFRGDLRFTDFWVFRRYLTVWTAVWMLAALLFFFLWGDSRSLRVWRHSLTVLALVCLEAAGALAALAGVEDSEWWRWDAGLYCGATLLLGVWAAIVPQAL